MRASTIRSCSARQLARFVYVRAEDGSAWSARSYHERASSMRPSSCRACAILPRIIALRRIEAKCVCIGALRFLKVTCLPQRISQVVVRLRQIWQQRHGAPAVFEGGQTHQAAPAEAGPGSNEPHRTPGPLRPRARRPRRRPLDFRAYAVALPRLLCAAANPGLSRTASARTWRASTVLPCSIRATPRLFSALP